MEDRRSQLRRATHYWHPVVRTAVFVRDTVELKSPYTRTYFRNFMKNSWSDL